MAAHKRIIRDLEVATARVRTVMGQEEGEETLEAVLIEIRRMGIERLGGVPKFVGLRLDGIEADGSEIWIVEVSYPDYDFRVKGTTALAAAVRMRERLREEVEE